MRKLKLKSHWIGCPEQVEELDPIPVGFQNP